MRDACKCTLGLLAYARHTSPIGKKSLEHAGLDVRAEMVLVGARHMRGGAPLFVYCSTPYVRMCSEMEAGAASHAIRSTYHDLVSSCFTMK